MHRWLSTAIGLLITLVVVALAVPVDAKCAIATPPEYFQQADAVFYGRVAAQGHPLKEGGTDSRFAVERVLKGRVGPTVTLWEVTGPSPFPKGWLGQRTGSSVDVGYRAGERYLVFANQSEQGWISGSCSGTRPLAALTAAALAEIGFGELGAHLPGAAPDPALTDAGGRSSLLWWVALAAGVALAAAVARRVLRLGPRQSPRP